MSKILKFPLIITTLLFSGCALLIPGDMLLEVKGSIPREVLQNGNICDLAIIDKSSGYLLFSDKEIDSDFSGGFLLAVNAFSGKTPVLVVVKCSHGQEYKSRTYMIGPRSYREFPDGIIDLGELTLDVIPSAELNK